MEAPEAQNDVDVQGIADALNAHRIADGSWERAPFQVLGHGSSVLEVYKKRQRERLGEFIMHV
jgi:hypothetical protein